MMSAESDGLTELIIGSAIKAHRHFGPGVLESVYEFALEYELKKAGVGVERQKKVPLFYDGIELDQFFYLDLLVENVIVIEFGS